MVLRAKHILGSKRVVCMHRTAIPGAGDGGVFGSVVGVHGEDLLPLVADHEEVARGELAVGQLRGKGHDFRVGRR